MVELMMRGGAAPKEISEQLKISKTTISRIKSAGFSAEQYEKDKTQRVIEEKTKGTAEEPEREQELEQVQEQVRVQVQEPVPVREQVRVQVQVQEQEWEQVWVPERVPVPERERVLLRERRLRKRRRKCRTQSLRDAVRRIWYRMP